MTSKPIFDPTQLQQCISCGFCLPACPTYRLTGDEASSPRGRIALMRAIDTGSVDVLDATARDQGSFCLGCRACEPVCPAGVPYGSLLEQLRDAQWTGRHLPIRIRPLLRFAASPRIIRLVGLLRRHAEPTTAGHAGDTLLLGCFERTLFPAVSRAAADTLPNLRVTRRQGCCGALHAHNGQSATGNAMASQLGAVDGRIVTTSGGCAAHLASVIGRHRVVDYAEAVLENPPALQPLIVNGRQFKGRRDLDIVRKAYRLHPPFGQGLMPKLGLKYRREFDMGNRRSFSGPARGSGAHGCVQEPGETWRAADADWYRSRGYIERPIAAWYAVFDGEKPVDHRVPWPIPKGKTLRRSDLDDFPIRLDLPGGLRFYGQGPDDGGSPTVFVASTRLGPTDAPVYVPGRKFLGDLTVPPCLRPGDVFLPLMEGKWIHQHNPSTVRLRLRLGELGRHPPDGPRGNRPDSALLPCSARRGDADAEAKAWKIGFRDVSKSSDERSFIASVIPASLALRPQATRSSSPIRRN